MAGFFFNYLIIVCFFIVILQPQEIEINHIKTIIIK